ncbi:hypothetical protein EDB86DRAFT_3100984 [Lactarius hatsudake]|nr:hypothetical protein EDB86DRAFT_3100984 [Lactarius hatsudake]
MPYAALSISEQCSGESLVTETEKHAARMVVEQLSGKANLVKALVLKECNAAGKKSGFKMLQAVVLTADEWTPESGLVTAAQKVQRRKVAERFDAEIKEAFGLRK